MPSCKPSGSPPRAPLKHYERPMNKQVMFILSLPQATTSLYDQVFLYLFVSSVLDRNPGNIEVLADLLAEDWAKLGSVKEMGEKTQRFFREELEKTWGSKHLAVLSEEEAKNWLLGVSVLSVHYFEVDLEFAYRGCLLSLNLESALVLNNLRFFLLGSTSASRIHGLGDPCQFPQEGGFTMHHCGPRRLRHQEAMGAPHCLFWCE